ncbi:tRNA modification GTPase [Planoprotostelium fungivorum]|uniref:tRNA modification GTPase n=1 Tax=Planoprotostelium fungivorum TaxID=1890364 RepID=A0A2P6N7V5_9EUKA|nr:tRNA modification GTPase [Planoprotostelium fungivorum]
MAATVGSNGSDFLRHSSRGTSMRTFLRLCFSSLEVANVFDLPVRENDFFSLSCVGEIAWRVLDKNQRLEIWEKLDDPQPLMWKTAETLGKVWRTSLRGRVHRVGGLRWVYHDSSTSASTVFSLASGLNTGRAAVSIVRISGRHAGETLKQLTKKELPPVRKVALRDITDPITQEKLDSCIALYFKGPESFTGEDVVELHLHGGRAVVSGVLNTLGRFPELSPAKPGEFTRRAFENGKLDLIQVEGLADLIDSGTEAQRRQALHQMSGEGSTIYNDWRQRIMRCVAHHEAVIDFGEDEHISNEVIRSVQPEVMRLINEIERHLDDNRRGERMREGAQIVIFGPPNAGKSSLLNLLAKREAAIVSEQPGTTRDIIEVTLNFSGFPVVFSDTAGIRNSSEKIEIEGIKRAKERYNSADLRICLLDADDIGKIDEISDMVVPGTIVVINKVDDEEKEREMQVWREKFPGNITWMVSVKTGRNIPQLFQDLGKQITECVSPLLRGQFLEEEEDCVLAAEELREALRSTCRIVGTVDVEENDLLNRTAQALAGSLVVQYDRYVQSPPRYAIPRFVKN